MPINWNLAETKIEFAIKNTYAALSIALIDLKQPIENLQNLQDKFPNPNNIGAFAEYIKSAKDFEALASEKIQPIIIDFTFYKSKLEKLIRKLDIKIENLNYVYYLENTQRKNLELYSDAFCHYFLDALKIKQRRKKVLSQFIDIQEDLNDLMTLKSETIDQLITIAKIILKDDKIKNIIFKSLDKDTSNWFENWIETCPFINHPIQQEHKQNKDFLARRHSV